MPPFLSCKNDKSQTIKSEDDESTTGVLYECDVDMIDGGLIKKTSVPVKIAEERQLQLVWRNIIAFILLHIAAIYGLKLLITCRTWKTIVFLIIITIMNGLGITGGAHRLWAHRAYKATWPLKLILIICNTLAFQDCVYSWARDHRLHHKYSETDADPHNATRGFFFAHIGWLLCRKHPQVRVKGKSIDMSDLRADPFVMFQKRHYPVLMLLACFTLPTVIPMYCWNETFANSFFICVMLRWCCALNFTWCVNSAAHLYGYKSYDKSINPVENLTVNVLTLGEGWHNYHHVFPWDYKASEWNGSALNLTTFVIDSFAKIGWAYDLKTVPKDVIERRVERTGDKSYSNSRDKELKTLKYLNII